MDELREKYAKKAEEMKEKYHDAIVEISKTQDVDMGVAFDMLLSTCSGGDYLGDAQIDAEELKKDWEELESYNYLLKK